MDDISLVVFRSAVPTLVMILVEVFIMKKKNSAWTYFRFFSLNFVFNMMFLVYHVQAEEKIENKIQCEDCILNPERETVRGDPLDEDKEIFDLNAMFLSDGQCEKYKKLVIEHRRKAQQCFREAEKICVLIPNKDDFEVAEDLFRAAGSVCLGQLKFSIVMATLLVALQEYGINIYRQWRKIQTLLLEAEYNFEMSEHYEYCMKQGQC